MSWDTLIVNCHLATFCGDAPYGAIRDGALAIEGERIAWVGARATLPHTKAACEIDMQGAWITPGLIDCHTHLVYAGNRAREFELRLQGASYADIARAGGGILATVAATRAANEEALYAAARPRLQALLDEGVTTVEIKSGYGLALAHECKQLRVARKLGNTLGVSVRTTLLAAHTLPPEFSGRGDDYIGCVVEEILPGTASEDLVDAVDAFCESIGFTPAQTRRVFEAARKQGLPVKLHADQLSDSGGAALAAEFEALSADHLEYSNAQGIEHMAAAGSVAVLLPGAFYFLRENQLPPVQALRAHGVPIAIATDCNPGSSPVTSLLLMLNMACTLFDLTPEEALRGVTLHAARALGLHDRGVLRAGALADLAVWRVDTPAELVYAIGANPNAMVLRHGKQIART